MDLSEYLEELIGSNYQIDEALVIGPYPTSDFFAQFSRCANNGKKIVPVSRLTILADDGWDQHQLDRIRAHYDELRGPRKTPCLNLRRVSSGTTGLVHAKIVYLTLKRKTGAYTKRVILLGSANASMQGFGVHAETYINVDLAGLAVEARESLIEYLSALRDGKHVEKMRFVLGRGAWVLLPAIKPVSGIEPNGFDAWLRRGRLCHKYQPDATFGRLTLRLKRDAPPNAFEEAFKLTGFGRDSGSREFRTRYVGQDLDDDNDSLGGKVVWREKYFIETYYGHWVGPRCYAALRHTFVEAREAERNLVLTAIRDAGAARRLQWTEAFEDQITGLARRLVAQDHALNLETYFETLKGELNLAPYRERARMKLATDAATAAEGGFAERYRAGYVFPRLPQLDDEFEKFALDWCRTVVGKLYRRGGKSALINTLRTVLNESGEAPRTEEELLKWLRDNWKRSATRIDCYHEYARRRSRSS